jgi:heme A synthase
MSAAADDPDRAAVRVSVVSSIGYAAFFTGPPLVAVLIHIAGLPHALLIVIAAAVLAAALSASTAQQPIPSG